jgi:hypothetical protein
MAKRVASRRRMAAEFRAQGLSLRAIAAELKVSEGTVRLDLAEWYRTHPNTAPPVRKNQAQNYAGISDNPGWYHCDFRELDLEPGTVDAETIPLARTAASDGLIGFSG